MRVHFTAAIFAAAWTTASHAAPPIEWNRDSLNYVTAGTYSRIARLTPRELLLSYEIGGRSYVRRSEDDGKTWGDAILVASLPFAAAANPQPLVLDDGTVWLLWNQRPGDGVHRFAIRLSVSRDGGRTWTMRETPLFEAGTESRDGCWEPAAVQLPGGDIHLFFANEAPYAKSDEQQIDRIISRNRGETWSPSQAVSFRPHFRDGMPVPIVLADGKTVALAFEDNGLQPGGQMKPAIVRLRDGAELPVSPPSAARWGALADPLPDPVYAGAPYLVRLADGRTLLSCQSKQASPNNRVVVYLGDADANSFAQPTEPFPSDADRDCLWPSLFVKDASTVIAVTNATIGGRHGVWTIEGKIAP